MSLKSIANLALPLKSKFPSLNAFVRQFSRRSVNVDGNYKVVKGRRPQKQEKNNLVWRDPNFDILASPSFPFFMPGNIGPAWYDTFTTLQNADAFSMQHLENVSENNNIVCRAQACPEVLKAAVLDLFPYRDLEKADLSVITITLKPDLKHLRRNKEIETEKLAQTFVITAKNVCQMLRKAGYWADFINPFSGRPYFSNGSRDLYKTSEKFRCLDFEIYEIQNCIVISNDEPESKRSFVGSLFTNAPSQKKSLADIFTK